MYINYFYILFNLFVLIIWFKTEAFVEYVKVFKLDKLLFIDKYEEQKKEDFELNFLSFLLKNYNTFFIRVITCPICLTSWLCIPVIFVSGFIMYPFYVVSILFLYYLFAKIM